MTARKDEPCAVCGGSGEIEFDYRSFVNVKRCDACDGLGWFEIEDEQHAIAAAIGGVVEPGIRRKAA